MQCIIMEKHSNKLTYHDETKKGAHGSQIVRAKENLKLSHGGSSYSCRGNLAPTYQKVQIVWQSAFCVQIKILQNDEYKLLDLRLRISRPLAGYGLPPPQGEFCRPYFS